MSKNLITLTNEFCRAGFEMQKLVDVKEIENLKYITADIKAIHWRMIFIELARLNSFDNEFDLHDYTRSELIKKLKTKKKYSTKELYKIIRDDLSAIRFIIPSNNGKSEHTLYVLPEIEIDEKKEEEGIITLGLNKGFKRYTNIGYVKNIKDVKSNEINNTSTDGFTEFREDALMCLDSPYAIRLYLYLYTYADFPTTSMTIDNIRKILNLSNKKQTKHIIKDIIEKACAEISNKHELTGLNVIPVSKRAKGSNKITSITFTLQTSDLVHKTIDSETFVMSYIQTAKKKGIDIKSTEDTINMIAKFNSTFVSEIKNKYNIELSKDDVMKMVGYSEGSYRAAFDFCEEAIKQKAGSIIGYVYKKAKEQGAKPLKMYKK